MRSFLFRKLMEPFYKKQQGKLFLCDKLVKKSKKSSHVAMSKQTPTMNKQDLTLM